VRAIVATGRVVSARVDARELATHCPESVSTERLYRAFADVQMEYGPAFQAIVSAVRGESEAVCELRLPERAEDTVFVLHPALLDAALQSVFAAQSHAPTHAELPFEVAGYRVHRANVRHCHVHVKSQRAPDGAVVSALSLFDDAGNPVASIERLVTRPARLELLAQSAERWLWQTAWRELSVVSTAASPTGTWLVRDDGTPLARGVVERLEQVGARCIVKRHDEASDWDSVLAGSIAGVVAFWDEQCVGSPVEQALCRSVAALELFQALGRRQLGSGRLWTVTRSALAVDKDQAVRLEQGGLVGLVRVMMNEHPELEPVLLDVDGSAQTCVDAVFREIHGDGAEPEVAWRGTSRRVPRWGEFEAARSRRMPVRLDADGVVVVTGGLGALGAAVARWLVAERGCRKLVLTGRRGQATPGCEALLAHLKSLGAETVRVLGADVSTATGVDEVLRLARSLGSLQGIAHAAGALDDALLDQQSAERFESAFAAKAAGAWHLHEATRGDTSLAFFVLFGSVAGALGNAGQANYAAANTFLAALAESRASQGLPCQCVDFGLWAGEALGTEPNKDVIFGLARLGSRPIQREEGLREFGLALDSGEPLLALLPIEGRRIQQRPRSFRRLVELQPKSGSEEARQKARGDASSVDLARVRSLLEAVPEAERTHALIKIVRDQIAAVAALPSGNAIQADQSLDALGITSLQMVELRNRFSGLVGERLPMNFFESARTSHAIALRVFDWLPETLRPAPVKSLETPGNDTVLSLIRSLLAEAVGVDDLEAETRLDAIGLDDVIGAELCLDIKRRLGVRILPREFRTCSTVAALVELVEECQRTANSFTRSRSLEELDARVVSPYVSTATTDVPASAKRDVVFILSPPRSGSTLLRVMLAGHSRLFSPQELHLAGFANIATYDEHLGGTILNMGLITTVHEVTSSTGAKNAYAKWVTERVSTAAVYDLIHERIGSRILVDKSPFFFPPLATLERLNRMFPRAKFVHLLRHPYSTIDSYARERFHKVLKQTEALEPYEAAEWTWQRVHRDIIGFGQELDAERFHRLRFEDLARDPEATMRALSSFLGVEFEPSMLKPYSGHRGLSGGFSVGDPNFMQHKDIDASKAAEWEGITLPFALQPETLETAEALGYSLGARVSASPKAATLHAVARPSMVVQRDVSADEAEGGLSLEDEARLPDDIQCSADFDPNATVRRVLLTGATGFLGAYLLEQLLTQTTYDVVCLARAKDDRTALRRVTDNLARYGIEAKNLTQRVTAIAADLEHPNLDVAPETLRRLQGKVDAIYHCAARVSWFLPFRKVRPTNVEGLIGLLRFVGSSGRPIPINYVSSLGSGLVRPFENTQMVREVTEKSGLGTKSLVELHMGYFESKWVTDRIVHEARRRGFLVNVFAPGLIVGHSTTGADSLSDSQFFHALIKGSAQLKRFPDCGSWRVVPVDEVARVVRAVSVHPDARNVHVYVDGAVSLRPEDMVDELNALGYPVAMESYASWRQRVLQVADELDNENALFWFTDFIYTLTPLRMRGQEFQMDWFRVNRDLPDTLRDILGERQWGDREFLRRLFTFYKESGAMPGLELPAPVSPRLAFHSSEGRASSSRR
jgi:thioester reductase-like protein